MAAWPNPQIPCMEDGTTLVSKPLGDGLGDLNVINPSVFIATPIPPPPSFGSCQRPVAPHLRPDAATCRSRLKPPVRNPGALQEAEIQKQRPLSLAWCAHHAKESRVTSLSRLHLPIHRTFGPFSWRCRSPQKDAAG